MSIKKILVVPMSAMAKTSGPFSRTVSLISSFNKNGIETALCAAKDVNFKEIKEAKYFELSSPMPFGLPEKKAMKLMKIGIKLGMPGRKTIVSFEEVLFITGALKYSYLKKSVEEIRCAIKSFSPDAVYSEFNISAIIAAIAEHKKIFCSYSYPVRTEFAKSPQFAKGVKRLLCELNIEPVSSALDLFKRADMRFVPSIKELEPIEDSNTYYCGIMKEPVKQSLNVLKDKILIYMGVGTISQKKLLKESIKAFKDSEYQVYIAGADFRKDFSNIHIDEKFNFKELFESTFLYVNHGGQNSIADALMHGIPQIIYPGKVFERSYNANSVQNNKAGIVLKKGGFKAKNLVNALNEIKGNSCYSENALKLGKKLTSLHGAERILTLINENN